jgi:hypothetical protein
MTYLLLFMITFMLVSLYFYLTRKFRWEDDHGDKRLKYKGYDAVVYTHSFGRIDMIVHGKIGKTLFQVTNCPSVKWGKDKAEQVILEDEEKNQES